MATTSSDAEAPGSPASPTTRTAGELPTWLRRTIIAAIVVASYPRSRNDRRARSRKSARVLSLLVVVPSRAAELNMFKR